MGLGYTVEDTSAHDRAPGSPSSRVPSSHPQLNFSHCSCEHVHRCKEVLLGARNGVGGGAGSHLGARFKVALNVPEQDKMVPED